MCRERTYGRGRGDEGIAADGEGAKWRQEAQGRKAEGRFPKWNSAEAASGLTEWLPKRTADKLKRKYSIKYQIVNRKEFSTRPLRRHSLRLFARYLSL
jgi:hypothetical protein